MIVPVAAELRNWAAALLAYSVMTNSSDTSLVRCQPRRNTSRPASTTTSVYRGRRVFGSRTSLNANRLSPSIVSTTAASSFDVLTSLTPNTSPRRIGTNASPSSTVAARGAYLPPDRGATQTSTA